jgi:hypothetical protein
MSYFLFFSDFNTNSSSSQMALRSTQSSTQVHVRTSGIPPQKSASQTILSGTGKTAQPNVTSHPGPSKAAQPSFTGHPAPARTAQPNFTGRPGPSKGVQSNMSNSQHKSQDHFLRMSLMEDVPRGGAVVAVPQE